MTENDRSDAPPQRPRTHTRSRRANRRVLYVCAYIALAVVLLAVGISWLAGRASVIDSELKSALNLLPDVKNELAANDKAGAASAVRKLQEHTSAAREAAEDPLWKVASVVPVLGANFSAVSEVARSADDVSNLSVAPLVDVFDSLNWDSLVPNSSGTDLEPLREAYPTVVSAAHAMRASAERLQDIETDRLLPQVAEPLTTLRNQLGSVTGALDAAADGAQLAPDMLGASAPRTYLLMIQNNAEVRASGGIPGALAILTVDKGRLSLSQQSSATALGSYTPRITVDPSQEAIYSTRLGKYMQDVNLTPDFPTAAETARQMWKQSTGKTVDGVISMDPVSIGYLLNATGPVEVGTILSGPGSNFSLPREINSQNVVKTLLSDVYAQIQEPPTQDAYFAGVAQKVFEAVSAREVDPAKLIDQIGKGASEGRILIWSAVESEQDKISRYPLSGAINTINSSPARFGVYFNDGTGAKMDYYVKRTVQLLMQCPRDGYAQTTVRIVMTNTAPADASSSLPTYVTGGGAFGVPPGSVQTNIAAYGPTQAHIETAGIDGEKTEFAPHFHNDRPVGVVSLRLAPGQTKTVEFRFDKIVQHTEPDLNVTPTVQPVKDVTLPTAKAACG
ncbi:DUF4012 domain-containing protein [Arthrobacter sp. BHU FT2]|nr:DUF4012 domain-containing protein [Arthrobacter sp. BHU FT2]